MAIQPEPNEQPDPVHDDSDVPPVLTYSYLGTVNGCTAVWTDARAVAGTLRGIFDAAASGEVSAERALGACGEIAERLDALVDGLAALGTTDSTTEENQ